MQVYAGLPDSADAAPARLAAFREVALAPGERERVELTVSPDDLRCWDEDAGEPRLRPGLYRIRVGTSSADLPLERSIRLG
ncbi:fibronectin type III-like domain-contianing protein [Nocardiopsis sp. Huas11]|uniref:fibronectin type III-like domain-contianing protein n=1 Tax=Nocardiopsis sp. Huas11 TaxID=2183912 RepID=UPI0013157DBD|nr:fibronectin type III-like domain-contianing protein [Nocardiopsis sp. Huas11]